ncbi:uncharacterized protein LOC130753822 [Actinidia eriantha]|uniref:uncharacterized protein LOC130753822 n=1 Tax=Actinidia eriantha TaxID=165200 RepID=UPI0025902D62|nr:uncharacterized protein LOC130753822 [Actinidia eriantha]
MNIERASALTKTKTKHKREKGERGRKIERKKEEIGRETLRKKEEKRVSELKKENGLRGKLRRDWIAVTDEEIQLAVWFTVVMILDVVIFLVKVGIIGRTWDSSCLCTLLFCLELAVYIGGYVLYRVVCCSQAWCPVRSHLA